MDPEKREPTNEKKEKFEKADELLNPTFDNSAVLYEKIDEKVYSGEKDYVARRGKIEACGYDSDTLSKMGGEIREEYTDLYQKVGKKEASSGDRKRLNFLQGLIFSKTGSGETAYSQHSDISVGLAYELVRQMRKANNFLAQPDSSETAVKRFFSDRKSGPATEETIQKNLDCDKESFEEKKEAALKTILKINGTHKRDQYTTAFDILETAIQPKETGFANRNKEGLKARTEFTPPEPSLTNDEIRQGDLKKAAEEETMLREMMSQNEQTGQQPIVDNPEAKDISSQKKRGFWGRMFGLKE